MPQLEDMKASYEKHKNLKAAALELGIGWQNLYLKLRKAGVQITGDKSRYGSDKDRLAAFAESQFRRIVPFAVSQNDLQWQSRVDFLVGTYKVDIKAARAHRGSQKFSATRWMFSVKKQEFCADFIVCFALPDNYQHKIFLLPCELVSKYQTVSIPTAHDSKSKWLQYEVSEDGLRGFFEDLLA